MAKIHRYLISNFQNELSYFKNNYSDNEIVNLVTDAYNLLENDFEEEENIENIEENIEEDEESSFNYDNTRYILNIEEIIDLKNEMLTREPLVVVENSKKNIDNSEDKEEELEDYNPADLIEDIINSDG